MTTPLRAADHAPTPRATPLRQPGTRGLRVVRLLVPLVPLHVAAERVSVSQKLLWVEYLTLGGTADLQTFQQHLRQPDPGAPEHEVVLEAIESVLADEGVPVRVR